MRAKRHYFSRHFDGSILSAITPFSLPIDVSPCLLIITVFDFSPMLYFAIIFAFTLDTPPLFSFQAFDAFHYFDDIFIDIDADTRRRHYAAAITLFRYFTLIRC
jgi:hypothetical protein